MNRRSDGPGMRNSEKLSQSGDRNCEACIFDESLRNTYLWHWSITVILDMLRRNWFATRYVLLKLQSSVLSQVRICKACFFDESMMNTKIFRESRGKGNKVDFA